MKRTRFGVLSLGALVLAVSGLTGQQAASQPTDRPAPSGHAPGMLDALARSEGITAAEAARLLDREELLQARLGALQQRKAAVDGAYFDESRNLIVNVGSDQAATQVLAEGLVPRRVRFGERALKALFERTSTLAAAAGYDGVNGLAVDIRNDDVIVDLKPSASPRAARLRQQLAATPGIRTTAGLMADAEPAAIAIAGREMRKSSGRCTLGFNGKGNGGNTMMYTVGHCVVGGPAIYDESGNTLGRGAGSTYHVGQRSADFGQIDIMTGVGQWLSIDTRAGQYVTMAAMIRPQVGATICKAGDTTGWTCGNVYSAYTEAVYSEDGQPDTLVTRLGWAQLCVERGDSGGPIISGHGAVGMVSGSRRDGHECGWNRGRYGTNNLSWFVYVLDVAGHYGGDILHT